MDHFLKFDPAAAAVETGAPAKEKIRSGRPSYKMWTLEEDGQGLSAGIWEATAGEWDVDYSEWEFFHVLSGISVLTEDGCEPVKLVAGDSFVIRPGFKGRWRVVETTRKHFVVKQAGTPTGNRGA
ncbi:cupin domain-containing protein [Consotaella aegiceratis]|uniref:cupin domain-containing protein n=1 Tax=Consotaella aegiceratis TaxID=3097961 RepID=UPI002F417445